MGKSEMTCDCNIIHEDVVKMFKKGFSKNRLLIKLSEFFHLLSDNTRISILSILDQNEVCVSDIANILDMTKSAVSHQLRVLKDANFIKGEKRGKEVVYSFSSDKVKDIFELAIAHISEE